MANICVVSSRTQFLTMIWQFKICPPPPQLRSIGSSFFLSFECAFVIAQRLFSYIRVSCCWISWTTIFLIVNNFLSKTCGNCARISCYVINKVLGVVGRCLLWQKSESGWDTVNFMATLSQLCIIFTLCKKASTIILPIENNYKIGPTSILDKE